MTSILYHLPSEGSHFPNPDQALTEPDGLLAVGGTLSIPRLKCAYRNGIFPWYSEGEPLMWWSPSTRCILHFDDIYVNRSLRKYQKKYTFRVKVNSQFEQVIWHCAKQREQLQGTWITDDMISAYSALHKAGIAHSLEVYLDEQLVGGLYGVMQNGVFCGESMFNTIDNASKLAMWALCNWLKRHDMAFIDCQMENPFLMAIGAKLVTRDEYLTKLKQADKITVPTNLWLTQELFDIYE